MNFFSRLFSDSRNRRKPLSRSPDARIYVVDATGLVSARQRGGNNYPSPRDHFFILKNLAQFASKEDIQMQAIFMGRQLKEASEGSLFKGVKVHYTDNIDALKQKIIEVIRENCRSKDIVVLTSDKQIEREAMAQGAACMRLSTLRKVLEDKEERNHLRFHRRSSPERHTGPQRKVPDNAEIRNSAVLNLIDPV